jgi:hypothetical protein
MLKQRFFQKRVLYKEEGLGGGGDVRFFYIFRNLGKTIRICDCHQSGEKDQRKIDVSADFYYKKPFIWLHEQRYFVRLKEDP